MFKKLNPFALFVIFYLLIWEGLTLLIHSQTSISPDTAQNIMWGLHPSLMYDLHPGLGALFLKPFAMIFPPLLADVIAISLCMIVTWYYLYKLLRLFYSIEESSLIAILSALSFFYMWEFAIQYNQNIILMPFWCASSYFFVKSMIDNNTRDWVLLSLALVLGSYAKFQIGLLMLVMLGYLLFNFESKYLKNIILSFLIWILLLIPGIISEYNIDFATVQYALNSTSNKNIPILYKVLHALESMLQLVNFIIAFIVLIVLRVMKKISKQDGILNKQNKAIIVLGLVPYVIYILLELKNGPMPIEWLVPTTTLTLPGIYTLLKLKSLNVNLRKIVCIGLVINLIVFIMFNIKTFSGKHEEHNNIGDGVAIAAQTFLDANHLPAPSYVSGFWKHAPYLSVFLKSHPRHTYNWQTYKNTTSPVLLIFPGCQNIDINADEYGYKLIKKGCENVKLTDKFSSEYELFSFYFIEKK